MPQNFVAIFEFRRKRSPTARQSFLEKVISGGFRLPNGDRRQFTESGNPESYKHFQTRKL
jgi:hypothetical protein